MIASELIPFLEGLGKKPNKALSQNFLIDQNIVRKIVQTAHIQPDDLVLEIGSGPGCLTKALLEAGAKVFAVEKDRVFAEQLLRLQTADQCLTSFSSDILTFDWSLLPKKSTLFKVVANLPYHITTPILELLIAHRHLFSSLTLMMQSEVAERLVAQCGSKEYGSLSLFFQFYAVAPLIFKVSASCFYPKPSVDSKVMHVEFRPPFSVQSEPFFLLMRRAFQQRRKMLRSSLRDLYAPERIENALQAVEASLCARPEELSLEQWMRFTSLLDLLRN